MAEDRAVGERERLHPLFLLTGLGGSLRGAAGGYAVIGYLAVSGRGGTALFVLGALLAMSLVGVLVYWSRFEFRVGADEIRIDSGIFSRTHRSIPFDRVQDVDITQGPLARLLGLAQVKFETGGSAAGAGDEGVLAAIPLERAEQLRLQVRGRRSGRIETAVPEVETERAPVYAMDFKRLALAGIFNFSLALFAGLFGLTQTMGDVLGFDPFTRRFWLSLLSAGDPIADFLLAHRLATAIAGAALLVLIGMATGIVRTTVRDFGFRLDPVVAGLRRRRGLFTRTDVTLPIKRAQAALILTGPVRDAFGWRELKLQSLARDEGGGGDHQLAPLASDEEIATVISEIGWRWPPEGARWTGISRAYLWTFAIAISPLIVIALVQAAVLGRTLERDEVAPLLILASIVVAAAALLFARWLAWRRTAYALDGERLLVRSGWWRRRLLLLPLDRVQSIDIKESLVSRWFGISTLVFGVAGGRGFSAHTIPAVERESARKLRDELLIRGP
ncbi:MAG: PH domain-containing protein [Sphingomonas sp.]|nr:PH domain-containing protein [Sphingomonas sp.]